jgi:hypothetical protein
MPNDLGIWGSPPLALPRRVISPEGLDQELRTQAPGDHPLYYLRRVTSPRGLGSGLIKLTRG